MSNVQNISARQRVQSVIDQQAAARAGEATRETEEKLKQVTEENAALRDTIKHLHIDLERWKDEATAAQAQVRNFTEKMNAPAPAKEAAPKAKAKDEKSK